MISQEPPIKIKNSGKNAIRLFNKNNYGVFHTYQNDMPTHIKMIRGTYHNDKYRLKG